MAGAQLIEGGLIEMHVGQAETGWRFHFKRHMPQYLQRDHLAHHWLPGSTRYVHASPSQFGTILRTTGSQTLAVDEVTWAIVELAHHTDFCRRQTCRRTLGIGRTLYCRGIKMAGQRVRDQAVDNTVKPVASGQYRLVQDWQARGDQYRLAIGTRIGAGLPGMKHGILRLEIECACARDNAVEIAGIALRLDQCFAASIGATRKIRKGCWPAIESVYQPLRRQGSQMLGAIGEVGAFLRIVAERTILVLMPHVSGTGDEATGIERSTAVSSSDIV